METEEEPVKAKEEPVKAKTREDRLAECRKCGNRLCYDRVGYTYEENKEYWTSRGYPSHVLNACGNYDYS